MPPCWIPHRPCLASLTQTAMQWSPAIGARRVVHHLHVGSLGRDRFPLLSRRQEELAVDKLLRPNAVVDAAAQVLDELAVDIRRDRRTGFRRVDGQFHVVRDRQAAAATTTPRHAHRMAKAGGDRRPIAQVFAPAPFAVLGGLIWDSRNAEMGTVPIFVRRKWDCPRRKHDRCCFLSPSDSGDACIQQCCVKRMHGLSPCSDRVGSKQQRSIVDGSAAAVNPAGVKRRKAQAGCMRGDPRQTRLLAGSGRVANAQRRRNRQRLAVAEDDQRRPPADLDQAER